jgi:phenylalanyl-tRNA synthetase beta chain
MLGALRGAKLMAELAEGQIAPGIVDYYPNPPQTVVVDLPQAEVTRLLGVEMSLAEIRSILESLEFKVEAINPTTLRVTAPDHRLDISAEPTTGRADLVEEIARTYGYDRLPISEMADELPPQRNNVSLDREERIRDLLVQAGLQEIITYRLTTPAAEARVLSVGQVSNLPYITLANPSTPERAVMRRSLLNSVLEVVAENSKHHHRVQMFEVGHVYLPPPPTPPLPPLLEGGDGGGEEELPLEQRRLVIVMTGPREEQSWLAADTNPIDFFDLKGVVESLLAGLHVREAAFRPTRHRAYHPGRVAELTVNGQSLGILGQLHPLVVQSYDLKIDENWPVLAVDLDLDSLLAHVPEMHVVRGVPRFPPVQQDIALIVDEAIPADQVEALIVQTGKPLLTAVRLFDLFRGEQIGAGKKSLAYSLTFQADDRTLTDQDAARQQQKIVQRLERELGAKLRS